MKPIPKAVSQTKATKKITRHVADSAEFICSICEARYNSRSTLRAHLTTKHGDKFPMTRCLSCFMDFASVVERVNHQPRCGTYWICTKCDEPFTFGDDKTFKRHVRDCGSKLVQTCKHAPDCSWESDFLDRRVGRRKKQGHEKDCRKSDAANAAWREEAARRKKVGDRTRHQNNKNRAKRS